MNDPESYYDILEIRKSATQDEIKKAFYKLANEYHPDKNSGATEKVKHLGEKRFKQITEAYDVLKEPYRRKEYDEKMGYKNEHGHSSGHSQRSNQKTEPDNTTTTKAGKKLTGVQIFWIVVGSIVLVSIIANAGSSSSSGSTSSYSASN